MLHTNKDIFLKCWLWSVISGVTIAILFWLISDVGGFFHDVNGGTIFTDLLIGFSVVGSYLGAGYVGWRIADIYYTNIVKQFLTRYKHYCLYSFIALVAIIYSPLSILALFWSVLAPYCVLIALSKSKKSYG